MQHGLLYARSKELSLTDEEVDECRWRIYLKYFKLIVEWLIPCPGDGLTSIGNYLVNTILTKRTCDVLSYSTKARLQSC